MKLYYAPGACSLAPHIVLEETGAKYQALKADLSNKTVEGGGSYLEINPKGQVPALMTDDGQLLTENAVILQYINNQYGQQKLMPPAGSWEHFKALEWINYVATEIHKGMGILFATDRLVQNAEGKNEFRNNTVGGLGKKFDFLSNHLKDRKFLMGDQFTLADAYLFTILSWHGWLKIDLSPWPQLMGFMERVKSRPAVQSAMRAEGLL